MYDGWKANQEQKVRELMMKISKTQTEISEMVLVMDKKKQLEDLEKQLVETK